MQPTSNDPNYSLLRSLFQDVNNQCCSECNSANVPYVCIKLGIFICPTCAHFLSTMGFKVRPIMGSSFSEDDISRLQSIGNLVSKQFWLARWTPLDTMPPPEDPNLESFLHLKYIDKRWTTSLSTSDGFSSPTGGIISNSGNSNIINNSSNSNQINNGSIDIPIVNKQQQGFSPFSSPRSSPKPSRHLIDDLISFNTTSSVNNGGNSNPLKFSGGIPIQPQQQQQQNNNINKVPFDPFSPIKSYGEPSNEYQQPPLSTSSNVGSNNGTATNLSTSSTSSPYSLQHQQQLSGSGNNLIDILSHPSKSPTSPSGTPQSLSPQHHSSDFKVHLIDIPTNQQQQHQQHQQQQPISNPFTSNEPLVSILDKHDDLHSNGIVINGNGNHSPIVQQMQPPAINNPFVEEKQPHQHPHHLQHHQRHQSTSSINNINNNSNNDLSSISLTLLSPSPSPSPSFNYSGGMTSTSNNNSNNVNNINNNNNIANFSNLNIGGSTSSACSTNSSSNITIGNSLHNNNNNNNNINNNGNNGINNSGNGSGHMISPSPSPNPFLPTPTANPTNNQNHNNSNIITPIPINPFTVNIDPQQQINNRQHPQQMYIQQQQQAQQQAQQLQAQQQAQLQHLQQQYQHAQQQAQQQQQQNVNLSSSAPLQSVNHSPIPHQPQHASSQFIQQQQQVGYQQQAQQNQYQQQQQMHQQIQQQIQQQLAAAQAQQIQQQQQLQQPIPQTPQPLQSSTDEDPSVLEVLNLKKLFDMSMMDKEEFEHRRRQIIDNLTKTTSPIPQQGNVISQPMLPVSAPAQVQPIPPPTAAAIIQQVQAQQQQQQQQQQVQPTPDARLTGTERVIRHRFDAKLGKWVQTATIVITEPTPFAEGAMRKAFRMKDLSAEGPSSQMVAKLFKDANEDRMVYFKDVEMQTYSKEIAERFNLKNPPKKIDFVPAFVMELVERQGKPFCAVEYFIEGKYEKHNNNFGYKNDFDRNTPQSFSHFSYEDSGCQLIVVDIQGVGDVYTDPQIHSSDGQGFGKGNLGIEGIKRFFSTHQCNPICHYLGLSSVNPKPATDESGTMPRPSSLGQSYVRPSAFPPNLQQSFSFNFPPLKGDQQPQQQNQQQNQTPPLQQQQVNGNNNNVVEQSGLNNSSHAPPPQTPLPPTPQIPQPKEKAKIEVFGDILRKLVS